MISKLGLFFLGCACFLTLVALSWAQDASKEDDEVVTTGVVASQEVSTGNSAAVDSATEAPGDRPSVIGGSVSRTGTNACRAVVTNASEKNSYAINFAVIGKDAKGVQRMKRTYAAAVKPKSEVVREITSCGKDLNLSVVVSSAKKM